MTFTNSKSGRFFVAIALFGALAFASGFIVPSAVHADSGDSWGDTTWGDSGWGDTTWGDSGWGDTTLGDSGWGDTTLGDSGWGDTTYGGDAWGGTTLGNDNWGGTTLGNDYWGGTTLGDDVVRYSGSDTLYDTDKLYQYTDEQGITYSYSDSFAQQSCGGTCSSFSTPGCTSCHASSFSSPPISVRNPSFPASFPVSVPSVNIPAPRPQPPIITQPSSAVSTTNVNTNTCTNWSCNTNVNNIDNSINGSFNTTSVAPLTPVYTTAPQYLVQYTYPQTAYPNPVAPNLSCVITARPTAIQNGQPAFLSWTSYGAGSAWLSDGIGLVAPNGTLPVRPNVSTNYVLTVSGPGGTRTCSTFVNVSGTYVSLTQIPYTGFDFGTIGNTIYWLGLLSFALASAYLVLYYKGGAAAFMTPVVGSVRLPKMSLSSRKERVAAPAPAMFTKASAPEVFVPAKASSGTPTPENLPIARVVQAPQDSMTFTSSKEGDAPRIIVTRK